MKSTRRKFVKQALATSVLPLIPNAIKAFDFSEETQKLDIHIFSKHLQFLDYRKAASMAAEMGFAGLDLTVRPKGHVLPGNVGVDLPNAIAEIKAGGSKCELITTSINSIDHENDSEIIETAGKLGIKYYRTNWFKYDPNLSIPDSMKYYQKVVKKLAAFNKKHNIVGCYQNHAGTKLGASYWEIEQLLKKADTNYFGTQYDIRHAVAEGGHSWVNGLNLLKDDIKVIVLKDFKWGKVDGKWKVINVPIGEGMVDFTKYFRLLKQYKINAPVSLHVEYPIGGAEKGKYEITIDPKIVYDAMMKDLKALQKLWREA